MRKQQRIACITYTNVAKDQIESGTDGHRAVHPSTIHSFCWSLIKDFQPILRRELPGMDKWSDLLGESCEPNIRCIRYDDLGRRKVEEAEVWLHHDDVLALTVRLMSFRKFRFLLTCRYPILLIDEYQDTNKEFAQALLDHFIETGKGPLIGFFGDHWQQIYDKVFGKIEHPSLEIIGKKANFRSVSTIVNVLNRIRPELPQECKDPHALGFVAVYHTNEWKGGRRQGTHWAGDLPADVAHDHLRVVKDLLTYGDWDFGAEKTKILMLTHKLLAGEQGYNSIAGIFKHNEDFIKKEDYHIKFLVDGLEPLCIAYGERRYGEMFAMLGNHTPSITCHKDKVRWVQAMDTLLSLRERASIGSVLDHVRTTKQPQLPDEVETKERELEEFMQNPNGQLPSRMERLRQLREVPYQEIIALSRFINEQTPFSTKHGVKGAEFENVLVVFGRGWNKYNFNEFLELAVDPDDIPQNKRDAFERNRNLFYVVCSRPKKRLAILFTQQLTNKALDTLAKWFGKETIHALNVGT